MRVCVIKFSIKAPLSCLYADLANFLSTFKENRSDPREVLEVQFSMLDDSFCCLRSLTFGKKIRLEFPNVPWMPESLSGCLV